jgi:recombinase-like protein
MNNPGLAVMTDLHARLRHQSLGRPLTADEIALAQALEKVFRAGAKDFEDVARALGRDGVKLPSGASGPWTAAVLEQELVRINASLDAAYAENGIGA